MAPILEPELTLDGNVSQVQEFVRLCTCVPLYAEAEPSRPGCDLRFMLAVQLYGPFLRSMVKCATKTQPGLFTGSAHCGDANLVPFLHFRSQDLGKDID